MRHFKIKPSSCSFIGNPTFENMMLRALENHLNPEEEEALLDAIRKGKVEHIDKLVLSSQVLILEAIKQYSPKDERLEKMMDAGKAALQKLAENEINNPGREHFLRLRSWYVKQAILKV